MGTGYSYSRSQAGWPSSDTVAAEQAYQFLVNWLLEYPTYLPLELLIGGSSYAGMFVPVVTKKFSKVYLKHVTIFRYSGFFGITFAGNIAGVQPMFNFKAFNHFCTSNAGKIVQSLLELSINLGVHASELDNR